MEFCKCGSIMINGGCSNKRCKQHNKDISFATFRQIDHIKDMMEQLNLDESKFGLQSMNNKQASALIKELEKMVESGEQQ